MPSCVYHFTIKVPTEVELLSLLFKGAGHKLFLVGGAVRDFLMNLEPKDFDVATDAHPEQVTKLLKTIGGVSLIEVGASFGVIKARFPSGLEIEIATFRSDVGMGRRPDSVVFSTIEDDVMRRDLTINALFYDIQAHSIVDYVGGVRDIENKVIRTVGDPELRFAEDRLRVLRAVRFACQFGAELHPDTERAISNNPSLKGVSAERIREELMKAHHKTKTRAQLALMLHRLDLWEQVLPKVNLDWKLSREVDDFIVWLALMLELDPVEKAFLKLKYTAKEAKHLAFLLDFLEFDARHAYHFLHRRKQAMVPEEMIRSFAMFAPPFRSGADKWCKVIDTFLNYRFSVSGDDLLKEGFKDKEVGIELERRENVLFLQSLHGKRKEDFNDSDFFDTVED